MGDARRLWSSTAAAGETAVDELLGDLGAATRALRRRDVSSLELTRRALDRLDGTGRRLNAVAELAGERALVAARAGDRERARGIDRGPLHGVPYGVKDVIAARGMPTRWGAPPYRDQVIDSDATVVRRLSAAGAVLVAKLSLIELAGAGLYSSPAASIDGPCRNPWDVSRWTGGSSSGSAAAVAAGLLPFTLGTETRGSLVIPAAFCGITAFRPTYGSVSRNGVMTAAWSMDKVGPLARTAAACATVLSAIAGPDAEDPTTNVAQAPRVPRGLVFGILPDDLDADPETRRAFAAADAVLRRIGGRVRRIALPPHDYLSLSQTIVAIETAASHEELIRSPRLDELVDPNQRIGLRSYLERSATEYARVIETRVAATRDLAQVFETVNVLIAPTVLVEAPPIDTDLRSVPRLRYAVLGAVAGVPGVSVPMGAGPRGLPLGLSLIGPRFSDRWLLRLAARYQRETDWHLRRPPV